MDIWWYAREKSNNKKTVQLTWINLQTTLWYSLEGQDCHLGPVGQQDLAHPKHKTENKSCMSPCIYIFTLSPEKLSSNLKIHLHVNMGKNTINTDM